MVEEEDGGGEGGGLGAKDGGAEAKGGKTGGGGELGFVASESPFGADEDESSCGGLRVLVAEKMSKGVGFLRFPEKKFQFGAGVFEAVAEGLRWFNGRRGGASALFCGFDEQSVPAAKL